MPKRFSSREAHQADVHRVVLEMGRKMPRPLTILTLLLMFGCRAVMADVGLDDLNRIRDLTRAGHYAAALEQHLSFHEESESSVGMAGVRLSFALAAWVELGELYPPARDALISLKEEDKALLLAGEGDSSNFRDFAAINGVLGFQEETLQVFLALERLFPDQAAINYLFIEDLLFENEEYEVIAKYIGNPLRKFEMLRHMRELSIASVNRNDSRSLETFDRVYVDGVVRLLDVLVAVGRREEALEVQERAIAYYPHVDIRNAIP